MGVALIALSAPRLAAAVLDLPARPIIATARSGAAVPPHLRAIAAEARRSSLEWISDGPGWADLGYLHLLEAERSADPARAPEFARAVLAHRRALALSPAQAYAWTRLAYLELVAGGHDAGVFLVLAVAAAPYDDHLVFDRLDLAISLWLDLDGGQRALVTGQIRFAAEVHAGKLARLAQRRRAVALVRAALAPGTSLRDKFEAAYRRL
jgi:hypothetical protein